MTSSDAKPEHLERDGWQRCFVADEPRLSEAVQAYEEIGYEVLLIPVPANDGACTECIRLAPQRYRLIYVRARQGGFTAEARSSRR